MRQGLLIILLGLIVAGSLWDRLAHRQPASIYPEIRDFRLFDQEGYLHRLYDYADARVVHLVAFDRSCAGIKEKMAALRVSRQSYWSQKPLPIYLFLDSDSKASRDDLKKWAQAHAVSAAILKDDTQWIARQLDFKNCGDWVVLNPLTWSVQERRRFIKDGAPIEYLGPTTLSFSNDIVPILESKCLPCHRDGGIAPWQMRDYPTLKGWSGMMRDVIQTRRMPPWGYDAEVGHTVTNSFQLQSRERKLLLDWIEQGSPKDFSDEDPMQRAHRQFKLADFGRPDIVVKLPTREIPATGVFDLIHDQVDLEFTEDRWLKAAFVVPNRPQSVHHAEWRLVLPDEAKLHTGWNVIDMSMEDVVTAFVPGLLPHRYAENFGRRIPKGAKSIVQSHYVSVGRPERVEMRLELYFYKEPPKYEVHVMRSSNRDFVIPPGAKNFTLTNSIPVQKTITVTGVCPHMHARGKWMKYWLHKASGERELIFSQPFYRFKWQTCFTFKEWTVARPGDTLVFEGGFDNSALNPDNPDPKAYVFKGERASDEMMLPFIFFVEGELSPAKEMAQ